MSQFSTMTTRERQKQAAAICREIQGPEGVEMDLGKKLSVPQDIMLEELSLTSNRGSVLFKKRQMRSEKYTFESIQNQTNTATSNGVLLQTENGNNAGSSENNLGVVDQHPKPPPNTPMTPDTRVNESNPDSIAPGYGGPLKEVEPERFNSTSVPKAYRSPWEQAIFNDPALAETLIGHMPEPGIQPELPGYKCFNRVAIPFGGFSHSSAPPPVPVKRLQLDLPAPPELHEDTGAKRPTFNRAPQGWISSCGPVRLPAVSVDPVFIPESDDL